MKLCHLFSNLIILGWLCLLILSLCLFCIFTSGFIEASEIAEIENSVPQEIASSQTWWVLFIWLIVNFVTWLTGVLVPASLLTENISPIHPPRCCFCCYQPGGHMMGRFHYFMTVCSIILGIVTGLNDDSPFAEFKEVIGSTNNRTTELPNRAEIRICYVIALSLNMLIFTGRIIIICCTQISSSDEDSRLSGILPTQMTRSQVAKFRLDHHKMIYKEKRRMSMPAAPRLSDIPEQSESQVSSRNVSKLSSSAMSHSALTLHST